MTFRWRSMTVILLAGTAACGCGSGGVGSVIGHETADGSGGGSMERGGAGTGGMGTGGATTEGIGTGDMATGGMPTGGVGTGGVGSGGVDAGGVGTGGAGTGGKATGGVGSGGRATGDSGTTSSGSAGGGPGTGGKATGGSGTAGVGAGGRGGTATGGTGMGGTGAGGTGSGGAVATGGGVGTGGVGTGGRGGATGTSSASCLDGITTYAANGPFSYATKTSGSVKMWIPKVPAGCKVPMVHYSNGTSATCSFYSASLVRLASNGFLALCYEDPNTGAGKYGIEAFKAALAQYPDVADYKFGSTGHSQGGMASLVTLQYAEAEWGDQGIYAGLAVEPASGFGDNPSEAWQTIYGRIKSPAFLFSGLGTDSMVSQSWVQQAFDALGNSSEAYFWAKGGANHILTVNQDAEEVLVSWFRWKLLGDQRACQYWKAIPSTDSSWTVVDRQNEVACE